MYFDIRVYGSTLYVGMAPKQNGHPYISIATNELKYGIVCRDIKTEKAHEQDWDGTLATKLNLTTST